MWVRTVKYMSSFFLAQLQGEVTAFEEDQKTMFRLFGRIVQSVGGVNTIRKQRVGQSINNYIHLKLTKSSFFLTKSSIL
jgi:hypothetical protein